MRRAQSLRNHPTRAAAAAAAAASAQAADDLGVLKETPEESGDTDWKKLYFEEKRRNEETIRERDDWKSKYNVLMDEYQALRKENKSNEILLQGTQKENVKCMSDISRMNDQLQKYEKQLEHLAGPNWRINLDLPGMNSTRDPNVTSISQGSSVPSKRQFNQVDGHPDPTSPEAALEQVEKVRLLIIGMEERLQMREEKLLQNIKRAEAEGVRFEELHKQVRATVQ